MHGTNFTTAAVSVLLLAALLACDSSVGPFDDIQLNVHGTVVSSRSGRPVAGATVDVGRGSVGFADGGAIDTLLESTTSDESGGFSFSIKLDRSRCEGRENVVYGPSGDTAAYTYHGIVMRAEHSDYFTAYPFIANYATIDCADNADGIQLGLSPRSIAVQISPDSARVRVDSTQDFTAIKTFVDGSSGPSYFQFWDVTGPPSICGSMRPDRYFAPAAVPQDGACGGGPGQVQIRVRTFDDVKYMIKGVSDTFYVTIIP